LGGIGALFVQGGSVSNRGIVTNVTVDAGSCTSENDGIIGNPTVNGGGVSLLSGSVTSYLTVNAADAVGALSLSGGTIDGSATLTASTFTQSGCDLAELVNTGTGATLQGGAISGTLSGGAATAQSGTTVVTGTVSLVLEVSAGSRVEVDDGNLSNTVTVRGTLAGVGDCLATLSKVRKGRKADLGAARQLKALCRLALFGRASAIRRRNLA
jgi:fibronectin-binding autotransporter adhesin